MTNIPPRTSFDDGIWKICVKLVKPAATRAMGEFAEAIQSFKSYICDRKSYAITKRKSLALAKPV